MAALSEKLGLETKMRQGGVGKNHLPQMAADAMKQTRLPVNNPRELGERDALEVYSSAW